jgi:hypothetical protein
MKEVLKQANDLLKAAKENPEQFKDLTKADDKAFGSPNSKQASSATHPAPAETKPGVNAAKPSEEKKPTSDDKDLHKEAMAAAPMKKDNQPHPAQSAPAHAHNVAEGDESLHHALKILDTPEKQKAMLHHLHSIHSPQQQRSPENRVAGGVPAQKPAAPAPAMKAEDILAQAKVLLKAAKEDPKQFAELTKSFGAPAAPAAAPMAPKANTAPKMPAGPKPPGMKAPSMRMSKEEIKADLAKPWKPKHMKQGC